MRERRGKNDEFSSMFVDVFFSSFARKLFICGVDLCIYKSGRREDEDDIINFNTRDFGNSHTVCYSADGSLKSIRARLCDE